MTLDLKKVNFYRVILFLLIIVISLYVGLFYLPFKLIGSTLITNPDFSQNNSGWKLTGDVKTVDEGHVSLQNENGQGVVALTQEVSISPYINDLVLTAEASSSSIVVGNKPWNSGRVVMVSYQVGSDRPDYRRPHELFSLAGTTGWQQFSELFHVYPGVDRVKLQIQLPRASGTLDVKYLQLHAAVYKDSWAIIKVSMIAFSMGFLVWIFYPYFQGRKGKFESAALGSVLLIVLFTAMPTVLKNNIYGFLKEGVSLMSVATASVQQAKSSNILTGEFTYFFSIMHYLFFAITAYLLLISTPHRPALYKFYDLFMLAVITECIQVFVRDRGPSIVDVAVDMAGVMTGFGLWYLWRVARWNARQLRVL